MTVSNQITWCKLTAMTFFMQSLMFWEVKKFVSPFLSTATFRMSSSKIGAMAFVGLKEIQLILQMTAI